MRTKEDVLKSWKTCKTCKYVWKDGGNIQGCNYFDIVGCLRGCEPEDCVTLGYYKPGKMIKRRVQMNGKARILEGEV